MRFFSISFLLVLIAFGAWFYGFLRFIEAIPRALADGETPTEAVIVLTGGQGRLEAGFDLFARDEDVVLFISGVTPGMDLEFLLSFFELDLDREDTLWKERISIGYQALDTSGNAEETANWIEAHHIRTLRLVTGNYHLPRSLKEFSRVIPDVEIIPHAVISQTVHLDSWWQWPGTTRLLISEYNKYLIVCLYDLWGV